MIVYTCMSIITPNACVSKGSLNLNKPAGFILGFLVANILIVIWTHFCVYLFTIFVELN
jgi:tetrahydromethanopterin S-methyltransferase subunit F